MALQSSLSSTVSQSLLKFDKVSTCNAGDPSSIPGSGRSAGEGIGYPLQYSWASLVLQLGKISPAMQKTWFNPWVGKIPWSRERLPTSVFWPGEFPGLYSSWDRKESDTTEWLSLSHVHWVGDAIQPSYPLPPPSPLGPQSFPASASFQWVSSSHQVAKVLGL